MAAVVTSLGSQQHYQTMLETVLQTDAWSAVQGNVPAKHTARQDGIGSRCYW